MAPNWLSSRQSGWGRADESPNMVRRAALGGVVILIVGVLIGVGITSLQPDGEQKAEINDSVIANPTVADMKTAPQTADGAVRAVTSYITGFPSVALLAADEQRKTLDEIVSPTADTNLRVNLQTLLTQGRQRLFGSGATSQVTARLVITPASYKVEMLAPDRARVQIWYMSVYVDTNGQQAQSNWTTVDMQVVWNGHWQVATYAAKGGPTPALVSDRGEPDPFGEVITVFNGFKAFRYAPSQPAG
jgi:hypothetical protein